MGHDTDQCDHCGAARAASTPFESAPAWVADAVFYQILPDRFAMSPRVPKPGPLHPWDDPPTFHSYKGGDLVGIVEHLDHLTGLGVSALYLNPIFQSASPHRYHTHDYFTVDPMLGGDEALEVLLGACHEQGVRVILDGVFNHASRGFFQFNDIAENGPSSPYWDWFHVRDWPLFPYDESRPPSYEAWWGMKALPKFNTDNPKVREYLMGVAEHWTRFGIDGWRLDVPEEIETEGFWEEFRTRVRAINPDAYIVGEVWRPGSPFCTDGRRFDGAMNYPLGSAIISFAAGDRIDTALRVGNPWYELTPVDAAGYATRVASVLGSYPEAVNLSNLTVVDTHDTARVLGVARGDRATVGLAALLQLTHPGAPSIYYGTEIGLGGGLDPDSRRAFPWDESRWDHELLTTYRELIALRAATPALRSAPYETVHAAGLVYAARRGGGDGAVYVVANAGTEAVAVPLAGAGAVLWGDAVVEGTGVKVAPRRGAVVATR
jgi:cyclomaltodextrinase / maltogenic alpha-amylase / neopullulanase